MKLWKRCGVVTVLLLLVCCVRIVAGEAAVNVRNVSQPCPILLYHHLVDEVPSEYASTTSLEKFEDDIRRMIEAGYQVISLEEMMDCYTNHTPLPEKSVVITFDDGYQSNYTLAFPVIKKYNIKASIFLNNDLVGKSSIHGFPHFSWEEAREMEQSGLITIYSHGYSHQAFTELSRRELMNSYRRSYEELNRELGERRTKAVAYVGGAYSRETFETLATAGAELQMLVGYDWQDDSIASYSFFPRMTVYYTSDVLEMLEEYAQDPKMY